MHHQFIEKLSDSFLDQKRQITDPEADAVIQSLVQGEGISESRRIFDRLIKEVEIPIDELPLSVQEFITQHQEIPDWVDWDQIKISEDVFLDHGPKFLIILYFKSLPLLYSMKNGAQVLVQTGRLAHDPTSQMIFTRRIAETGQFLLQVMEPDAFQGGTAINAILKVRLIHAAIRHFVQLGEWNPDQLGKPINQEDMAATLMTFSVSLTEGLRQFSVPITEEEENAYLHRWRLVGFYLGIDHDLIPQNTDEGNALLDRILKRQSTYSEEGELLTKALISFSQRHLLGNVFKISPKVMIRFLTGQEIASNIGVHRDRFWWFYLLLPAFVRSFFRIGERLEERVGPLEKFVNLASFAITKALVGYFDKFKQPKFQLHSKFIQKWDFRNGLHIYESST